MKVLLTGTWIAFIWAWSKYTGRSTCESPKWLSFQCLGQQCRVTLIHRLRKWKVRTTFCSTIISSGYESPAHYFQSIIGHYLNSRHTRVCLIVSGHSWSKLALGLIFAVIYNPGLIWSKCLLWKASTSRKILGNVCSLINPKQLDSILQRTFTDHRQT